MAIAGDTEAGVQYADCHFYRLPAELRIEIHQLTLTRDGVCRISLGDRRRHSSKHLTQINDFLVCKKWFSEAYPEYLQHNEFEFKSIDDLKRFVEGHEISRMTIRAVSVSCFWDAYMRVEFDGFFHLVTRQFERWIKNLPPLPGLNAISVHCELVCPRRYPGISFETWEPGLEEAHQHALEILKRISGVKVVALKTETIGPFCVISGPARGTLLRSGEPEQSWSRSWSCEAS